MHRFGAHPLQQLWLKEPSKIFKRLEQVMRNAPLPSTQRPHLARNLPVKVLIIIYLIITYHDCLQDHKKKTSPVAQIQLALFQVMKFYNKLEALWQRNRPAS